MTHLSVRPARPDDAERVGRILEASYPALMADAYAPDVLARALPLITRPHPRLLRSGSYYLCEAEGEAVGCGGWSFEVPGGGPTEPGVAHIRHFATDARWAGRGVGRALYRRCEAEARAAGARQFDCFASLNGEGFYTALGFDRIGAMEAPMGDFAFPSILMRRAI